MRFHEKLTNFFASAYSNNSKYNSSYLVYLRILFERNSKFKATFDKLGNVFRNSKWNDLKVQNIKVSLINSWFFSALSFFLFILFLFSFFGYTNNQQTFFLPAFVSELWGLIFFILSQVSNTLTLFLLKLSFFLLSCKIYLYRMFGFNSNFVFDSFINAPTSSQKTAPHKTSMVNNSTNYSFTSKTLYSNELIEVTHSLSNAIRALRKLKDSKTFDNFILSLQKTSQLNIEFLIRDTLDFGNSEASTWKPRSIVTNILAYKPSFNFEHKSLSLNLNNLNEVNKNALSHTLSNFNIYTNLNQSKQNRWLLKNSLLSNNIASNLFHFTQAKTLVGNSLYNSSNSSENIWNSSKFSQLSKINELSNLAFFKNNSLNNSSILNNSNLTLLPNMSSSISNFNFFEESQFWNNKKYFFTNQLKSNIVQLSNSSNLTTLPNNTYSENKSKLYVLLNQQNQILNHQILPYYLSCSNINKDLSSSSIQFNSALTYALSDIDHLNFTNSSFLMTLTTTNTLTNLPIHTFLIPTNTTLKIKTPLVFKN